MLDISEEAIRRNEHLRARVGDLSIRQFVTRGPGAWAATAGTPSVIVTVEGIDFAGWGGYYNQGAHAVVARTRSYSSEALDPKVKHHSRLNFDLAELEAADVDPAAWPILTDSRGTLTEGTGWNVFLVSDGVIRTPGDAGILQGVSRGAASAFARQIGIPVVEESLQPYDLYTADEAFFSSTFICVIPVTRADNRPVGDGKPGPVTQQLLAAWSEAVGLDVADQMERFGGG
jgi:branched-chain amino acid aminotransferase